MPLLARLRQSCVLIALITAGLATMPVTISSAAGVQSGQETLNILAKADLIPGEPGAQVGIYVNAKRITTTYVSSSTWTTVRVLLPTAIRVDDQVDVLFENDHSTSTGDRNLYIQKISNSSGVEALPKLAKYDRGDSYRQATDDRDVSPGQEAMPWNGALRFAWPRPPAPAAQSDDSAPGPRLLNLRASSAIIAKTGQTIRGLRISCSAGAPAITIPPGAHDVTIEDNEIGRCGAGVVGILADKGSYGITVQNNRIHGVASGMWAMHAKHPIVFRNNVVTDILGPFPRGQMIQLDNVTEGNGQTKITGNVSDWFARTQQTRYEDHVNAYMSKGTAQYPILIQGNKLRGGDSDTGSAIVVGDQGGAYFNVSDNIVVAVPNTGIALFGTHLNASGNRIYNVFGPTLRTRSAFTVWNVDQVDLRNNRAIASYCNEQDNCDLHMGFWFGPNSTNVSQKNNNWFDRDLTAGMWSERWNSVGWVR